MNTILKYSTVNIIKIRKSLMDIIDKYQLSKIVKERLNDGEKSIKVDIDEL